MMLQICMRYRDQDYVVRLLKMSISLLSPRVMQSAISQSLKRLRESEHPRFNLFFFFFYLCKGRAMKDLIAHRKLASLDPTLNVIARLLLRNRSVIRCYFARISLERCACVCARRTGEQIQNLRSRAAMEEILVGGSRAGTTTDLLRILQNLKIGWLNQLILVISARISGSNTTRRSGSLLWRRLMKRRRPTHRFRQKKERETDEICMYVCMKRVQTETESDQRLFCANQAINSADPREVLMGESG